MHFPEGMDFPEDNVPTRWPRTSGPSPMDHHQPDQQTIPGMVANSYCPDYQEPWPYSLPQTQWHPTTLPYYQNQPNNGPNWQHPSQQFMYNTSDLLPEPNLFPKVESVHTACAGIDTRQWNYPEPTPCLQGSSGMYHDQWYETNSAQWSQQTTTPQFASNYLDGMPGTSSAPVKQEFYSAPCSNMDMMHMNPAKYVMPHEQHHQYNSPPFYDYQGCTPATSVQNVAERLLQIELTLCANLMRLTYPETVTHIYSPLDYALEPHSAYLKKYCTTQKEVLFLGMNPGPFGMAQTGVSAVY